MRLLLYRIGLASSLAVCAAPLACSQGGSTFEFVQPPPGNTLVNVSIAFDDTGTLTLAPGMSQALQVTVTPPMAYEVSFLLVGETYDGAIEPPIVSTDTDGTAAATLRAPMIPTTFNVRTAVLGGGSVVEASAERAVAVSEQGFGSVRVTPLYLGARRHRHFSRQQRRG